MMEAVRQSSLCRDDPPLLTNQIDPVLLRPHAGMMLDGPEAPSTQCSAFGTIQGGKQYDGHRRKDAW
jgi:hypothetical protein